MYGRLRNETEITFVLFQAAKSVIMCYQTIENKQSQYPLIH